jgi:signal transduction histidine kinase
MVQRSLQIEIRCRLDRVSPVVVCEIEDNGPGISAEAKNRIFEPFFTTRGDGGTGLGLGIAKLVLESFGGAIAEIGEYGKGACFQLRFPLFSFPDSGPTGEKRVDKPIDQP